MDSIVRLEDIEKRIRKPGARSRNMKIMIFGKNGSGKTTLAMTAPNPFLLNVEPDGDDSTEGSFDDARVLDIYDWQDLEAAYELLYTPKYRKKFDSLIIDSATETEAMCLWEVVAPGRPEKGKLISGRAGKVTEPQWGEIGRKHSEMILNLLRLADSYNIILIAQEKVGREDKNEEYYRAPDLRPASLSGAMRRFSVIAHLENTSNLTFDVDGKLDIYEFQNRLTIVATPGYAGKDRTSGKWLPPARRLPPVINNPSLRKIIRRYRGEATRPAAERNGKQLDTTGA